MKPPIPYSVYAYYARYFSINKNKKVHTIVRRKNNNNVIKF